jgi:hypothetical protein
MHMAVDEAGSKCRAFGIDRHSGFRRIYVLLFAHGCDSIPDRDYRIRV